MKILTTIYSKEALIENKDYLDGIITGNEVYATRLTHSFELDEILEIIDIANRLHKECFITLNQMYTNEHLEEVSQFIDKLPIDKITGYIIADIGVYMILKDKNLHNKAIYNPETLLTNYFDFNYLAETGIFGGFVAKEITLEDIKIINKNKKTHTFMVGHGHLNMFYSKRKLLKNYADYLNSKEDFKDKQDLLIIEEKRKDDPYPVLEDYAGTHVFRSKVFSSLEELSEIKKAIDYLVIDTIFKDDAYLKLILPMYYDNQINKETIDQLQSKYNESWDKGFLFNKTFYKR
ncbi:Peptidase U32 family protein [Alteracholeplasma palmae J233]|uniref:Peptidase U32 family protein n=1 Tax=Alteracholeplasma palmae (strain ATCC 49389 / J233) TaxID=1318466 RepID=U4KKR9_ALTPJ|nr:U32 family peptidase [Alteracholeplasma palmae]CCV64272.1 Peptidase U32 family protein [Alteracholeplasma palmae J233]